MWQAIRVMRTIDAATVGLVAGASRTRAAAYLRKLAEQGLLVLVTPANRNTGTVAAYRLRTDPGPHAPGSPAAIAFARAKTQRAKSEPRRETAGALRSNLASVFPSVTFARRTRVPVFGVSAA